MSPGIVAESDLAGTLKSEYVFFGGQRVARRDLVTPTGVFYYFSDRLKTASAITDSAGVIKDESYYYPWGGELQFVDADSNHYKFTGKERDGESGLDYSGARYYSNRLGRFITPDWAAKAAAVPYAEFSDPQSLNLYTYAISPRRVLMLTAMMDFGMLR
jgi:RHS repeat-associated protein